MGVRVRANRLVWLFLLFAGCQTYDFERVEPFAVAQTTQSTIFASKRLKPNIMLLVDNSGSMLLPTDPDDPACPLSCGRTVSTKCPASCKTRVTELKSAMGGFLTTQGTVARFGLTVFPQSTQGNACQGATNYNALLPAPTRNDEGTEATLVAAAGEVNRTLQALPEPLGGTPTAASLDFVGKSESLLDANDGREDLVLLLTDGLPNCDAANAKQVCDCGASCSAARVTACACTQDSCDGARCAIGCLDQDGTVAQVRALRQKGIRTVVVGFGAEVARGDGPVVLKAMAAEGGFPRACPNGTIAECGGGACDAATRLCAQSYYSARNAAELEDALLRISAAINPKPCTFRLEATPGGAGAYLAVVFDGHVLIEGSSTYAYDAGPNEVTFQGTWCQQLERSTPQDPVKVEFRIVQRL